MNIRFAGTLRARIFLSILTIFGLLIMAYFLFMQPLLHQQISALESEKLNIYALSVASDLNLDLAMAITEVENAATLPEIRQMDPPQLDQVLSILNKTSSFSQAFTVLDTSGQILSRPSKPERVGENRASQAYFIEVKRTGRTFISSVFMSTAANFSLILSTPIYNENGEFVGVLTSSLGLADRNPEMYEAIVEPDIPPGWEVFLVTTEGILVAHSHKPVEGSDGLENLEYTAHPLVTNGLNGQWGIQEIELKGQSWQAASAPISISGWTIVVQTPTSLILGPVNDITARVTIVMLSLTAVLSGIGVLLANRFMAPVEHLTAALRRYGKDGEVTFLTPTGIRAVATAVDAFNQMVAEREKAIAQLDYQATLLQNVSDAVISTDANFMIKSWNGAAEMLYGRSADEVMGAYVDSVVSTTYLPPDTPEHVQAELNRHGHWAGEVLQCHRDGTAIHILADVTQLPAEGKGAAGAIMVNRDITHRKQTEYALQETEKRFRELFEQAAIGLAYMSLDGQWVMVNSHLCQMLGYTEEELLSTYTADITFPEDKTLHLPALERLKCEQTATETFEKRYIHKNGAVIWATVTFSLLRDKDGQVQNGIAAIQDISSRKKLEEQLLQSQKMQAIGRLAGGVAHDFNNLLTIIMSYSDLLRRRNHEPATFERYVQQISTAAKQAALLTQQLLTFSRKQIIAPKVINLNDIIEAQTPLLQRLIPENIRITHFLSPDLGPTRIDKGNLEQVLLNLLVNARDAMPDGGLIIIETANVSLDKTYTRKHAGVAPGNYAMLSISDNGIGMDDTTLAHIFEPFFTTKKSGEGTGLGLSTVYGIVQQSQGHIWVYSEPNIGTTFKIYWPLTDADLEQSEIKPLPDERVHGQETIMVVEDNDELRELAEHLLQLHGYQVLTAPSGEAALAFCQKYTQSIDLLLTDLLMPGMNGRQLMTAVTNLFPDIHVLYMSGYTDNVIAKHGVLEEGVAFLQKPFSPSTLLRKVRQALDLAVVSTYVSAHQGE